MSRKKYIVVLTEQIENGTQLIFQNGASMNDRDVGGMGEAEFKKWCNSVGLAANKFHEDKTGKDFLVEFPLGSQERCQVPFLGNRQFAYWLAWKIWYAFSIGRRHF